MVNINPNTPQLKVVQKWIDAYLSLDVKQIESLFSRDFKHQTSPRSLGQPEETKDDYLNKLGRAFPMFTSFESTIHDVVGAPGKAVVHATDVCSTVYGVPLTYEAIYTLTFVEEDGELKLSRLQQFIDTQEYATFLAKVAEASTKQNPTS